MGSKEEGKVENETIVNRYEPQPLEIMEAMNAFVKAVEARMAKHGRGAFVGKMEALGTCTEEWKELMDACQSGDIRAVRRESMDLAVAAFWSYLSTFDMEGRGIR